MGLTQSDHVVFGVLSCLTNELEPIRRWLAGRGEVAGWELLRGPWELAFRLTPETTPAQLEALIEELRGQTGVRVLEVLRLQPLAIPAAETQPGEGVAGLWTLLELEPSAAPRVLPTCEQLPGLETLALGEDGCQLLLVLHGPRFADVVQRINELAAAPGVVQTTTAQLVRLPRLSRPVPGEAGGEAGGLPRLQQALWRYQPGAGELIPLLQAAQDHYSYLPAPVIELIAGLTGTAASEIYGIVTFYAQFRLTPLGRYLIRQCHGTACHVNGARELQGVMEDELGVAMGQTDPEGLFTLSKVACLGCCSLAPVVMINDDTHGRLEPGRVRKILKSYRKQAKQDSGPRA